jgi:nitrite reductase (NADH) small subunit
MTRDTLDRVGQWMPVCPVELIPVDCGVCALIGGRQIALVRLADDRVFALDNFDPFSKAFVLARGIVGSQGPIAKIASPISKRTFDLATGACLEHPEVRVATWPCRVEQGQVQVAVAD